MPRLPQRPDPLGGAPKCGNPVPRPGMALSPPSRSGKNRKETPGKAQADQSSSISTKAEHSPQHHPAGGKEVLKLPSSPATTFFFLLPKEAPSSMQPFCSPFTYSAPNFAVGPSSPTARKKTAFRKESEKLGREGCRAAASIPPQWPQLLKPISCLYLLVRMLALCVSLDSTVCSPRRW